MKILVIHNNVPRPDHSGAEARFADILLSLRSLGNEVVLVSLNDRADGEYIDELAKCQITTYAGLSDEEWTDGQWVTKDGSFDALLRNGDFDLAILTLWFWSFLSVPEVYLAKLWSVSPRTKVAVLTEDRHGERQKQAARLKDSLFEDEFARDLLAREIEVYRKSDLILTITEAEKRQIAEYAPSVPCWVVPFSTSLAPPKAGYDDREGVCMLANFSNMASRDAGDWLLDEIFPLIHQELPDVTLVFAGPYSQESFGNSGPCVRALGQIDDIRELLENNRVFVSPLRYGTGISTKNVTAMAHGLPVVTTTCGAQSLGAMDGVNMLCADDAETFAAAVVRVYHDKALWQSLSRSSVDHISAMFCRDMASCLKVVLDALPSVERHDRTIPPNWSTRRVKIPVSLQQAYQVIRTPDLLVKTYVAAGFVLLRKMRPSEALDQFRHAISVLTYLPAADVPAELWSGLEQGYQSIGEAELSEKCRMQRELHGAWLQSA